MLSAQLTHLPPFVRGLNSREPVWGMAKQKLRTILSKLILAFALISSLTVLASGVALVSYGSLGEKLRRIETQSLPNSAELYVLSRQASALSALPASIAAAGAMEDVQKAAGGITELWASMNASLARLADGAESGLSANALRASAEDLANSAVLLAGSVAKRLELGAERQALVSRAAVAGRRLSEALAPLLDDANFNLDLGLRLSAQDTHKIENALRSLGRNELPTLVALAGLKAETNLIGGLLAEIALAPERAQLAQLSDRLIESVDRARKAAGALGDRSEAKTVGPALEDLLAFASFDSIVAVRDRELSAVEEEWKSAAESRAKGERLAAEAEKAANLSRDSVSLAIGASTAEVGAYRVIFVVLSILSLAALAGAFLFVRRSITGRLNALNMAARSLADGDLTVAVPGGGHDEIADMGAAVETFKTNALKMRELEAEQSRTIARTQGRQARLEKVISEFEKTITLVVAALTKQVDQLRSSAGTLSEAAETATFEAATAAHVS
ncbi:MAG: HAMP domain-containing protein, partial [Rhodomicrobium sp.]